MPALLEATENWTDNGGEGRMEGDGKWRTQSVGDGPRPFVVWRIVNGHTEYHRTASCNYGPRGRIVRLSYESALKKAQQLNGSADQ